MDFSFMSKYYVYFLDGIKGTLLFTLSTIVLGILIGILINAMRNSNFVFKAFAVAYVEIVRSTPLLVQLMAFYYLPTLIGVDVPGYLAAVIAMALNSGAYVSEIIRSGIQSLDKGQAEAARSLGMSKSMTMKEIILPQAFKNVLPALANEFITIIKESSVAFVIGVQDLMAKTNIVIAATYSPFEPIVIATIIYFILCFSLSKLVGLLEKRLKTSG